MKKHPFMQNFRWIKESECLLSFNPSKVLHRCTLLNAVWIFQHINCSYYVIVLNYALYDKAKLLANR